MNQAYATIYPRKNSMATYKTNPETREVIQNLVQVVDKLSAAVNRLEITVWEREEPESNLEYILQEVVKMLNTVPNMKLQNSSYKNALQLRLAIERVAGI
jgi:hypothetical protein